MKPIGTEQLESMREEHDHLAVVNVLDKDAFLERHIPGSANIPVGDALFESRVEKLAGGKDRPVVVYCASDTCDASPKAAEKLDRAGFERVYDYEGGMEAWKQAGNEVESGMPS